MQQAASRIESVIVGDLPDQSATIDDIPAHYQCTDIPSTIDDMWICNQMDDSLPDFVEGTGGYDSVRFGEGNLLPYIGFISLNPSVANHPSAVLLHEMFHSVGFGTVWIFMGLIDSSTPPCSYSGSAATAEFQSISGCSTAEIPMPETDSCQHWGESCLQEELMTPMLVDAADGSTPFQLSRITIASLQDMGYQVDYGAADPYTSANMGSSCTCNSRRFRRDDHFSPIPAMSDELQRKAVAYGRQVLTKKRQQRQRRLKNHFRHKPQHDSDGSKYVGDQFIFLMVREGNVRYSMIVTNS
ncbi:zinc metalloendopeptidase [Seminavis robusta]|uniref:Zinc metalloendopeptidase n=1 Tax=Seminavis robusta TaxID=568900 RepID=A0A9N8HC25_9STRA|nr:zinc metalloendopeptidase [Seminavis robusta]|eukprot:Sro282_g107560.1 zinc metalloendopeptidase (299) ;mRNA; r:61764-62660